MATPALIKATGRLVSPFLPDTSARLAVQLATRPRRRKARRAPLAEAVTLRFGLKALRWGQGGPSVLALHGWEGGPQQFQVIGESLATRGFRLFALTGPGHGDTGDRLAHPGLFADALVEAAAELGPLHGVIGHSMGAGAVMLAQMLGLRVGRSVCVAGPAGYRVVLERIAAQLGLAPRSRARFLQTMESRTGLKLDDTHPAHVLKRIDGRLLVVHDREDTIVPYEDATEIVRHGADRVQLLPTSGLGHSRLLKDRTVADAIAQFLDA